MSQTVLYNINSPLKRVHPCNHDTHISKGVQIEEFHCNYLLLLIFVNVYYLIIDIDECATDTDNCGEFCHNLVGSYYCSCSAGYQLDSDDHTCVGMYIFSLTYTQISTHTNKHTHIHTHMRTHTHTRHA